MKKHSKSNRTKLSTRFLDQLSTTANALSIEAGKMLLRGIHSGKGVKFKGRIDPVTKFDLRSEKLITTGIRKRFPDHAILAEEGSKSKTDAKSEFRWIIDPLDGTVNFAHQFPIYCVSIACEYRGEVVVGAVYDPERAELFSAKLGHGAFVNRRRMAVSSETRLERSLVATGFAYDIGTARKNNLGYFMRVAKVVQGVRRPGSAAIDICWLAAGRVDAFWELKLHPWDTAAALLCLHEAGGRSSRMNGAKYDLHHPDLVASNSLLHAKMLRLLKRK